MTEHYGTPVKDGNLTNLVAHTPAGAEVTLTVFRDRRERQLRARPGELLPATVGGCTQYGQLL
jgi:hypothetical protein